jgi:hypothetical protein
MGIESLGTTHLVLPFRPKHPWPTLRTHPTLPNPEQRRRQATQALNMRTGLEWIELARIAFLALAAAAVWFRVWEPFPRVWPTISCTSPLVRQF